MEKAAISHDHRGELVSITSVVALHNALYGSLPFVDLDTDLPGSRLGATLHR